MLAIDGVMGFRAMLKIKVILNAINYWLACLTLLFVLLLKKMIMEKLPRNLLDFAGLLAPDYSL